jgi:type I restriction enzyme S subunit
VNAARLLRLFDRVADAPEAVSKLRAFVLDLAVRGRLSLQDPCDAPAAELLRDQRALSGADPSSSSLPFSIPSGWLWTTIGSVCSKTGSGSTPRGGREVYRRTGVPFLRSQNVHDGGVSLNDVACIDADVHARMSGTAVRPGDLLLNITGGSLGRCALVPREFPEANVSQHVAILRPAVGRVGPYLHLAIRSRYFQALIVAEQTGAGRGGLPKNRMDALPLPLPPLAEQHRIVAKVDELMALCDQLEEAHKRRDASRDMFSAATVGRPEEQSKGGDSSRSRLQVGVRHFAIITERPYQLAGVRHATIELLLAGRHLAQPRSVTMPSSPTQKPMVAGINSKPDHSGRSSHRQVGEQASVDSKTTTLSGVLRELKTGPFGSMLHQSDYRTGGTPVVNPASMRGGRIVPIAKMAVDESTVARLQTFKLIAGDVVMARRGEMGRCAVVTSAEEGWLCGTGSLILRPSDEIEPAFLALTLGSPSAVAYLSSAAVGVTMQNLNQAALLQLPLVLPSLSEQRVIVATARNVAQACERLEKAIDARDITRKNLLEALLAEALAPAGSAPAESLAG